MYPLPPVRECSIYDDQGNRYLMLWRPHSCSLGYGLEEMADVINEQARNWSTCIVWILPTRRLKKRFRKLCEASTLSWTRSFCFGGTGRIEIWNKIARKYHLTMATIQIKGHLQMAKLITVALPGPWADRCHAGQKK